MAATKEEYLKKYLSGNDDQEKKKKRKKKPKLVGSTNRMKIVDDDVDFKTLLPENIKNTLDEDINIDEPTVADFIDERPKELQILEKYRQDKRWKLMAEDEKNNSDSDASLSTKRDKSFRRHGSDVDNRNGHDSDSDAPVMRSRNRHDSDSDAPVQKSRNRHDSDSDAPVQRSRNRHDSDSDALVQRSRYRHDPDSDAPVQRSRKRQDSDSDAPVQRSRNRHDSDSDAPMQRSRNRHDLDSDPPVQRSRNRQDSENDAQSSKPAKYCSRWNENDRNQNKTRREDYEELECNKQGRDNSLKRKKKSRFSSQSPKRKQIRHDSDSDHSELSKLSKNTRRKHKRQDNDSDNSPVRKKMHDTDSDHSPVRKGKSYDSDQSARRHSSGIDHSVQRKKSGRSSSPQIHKGGKMTKTLGGAKAGLSTAKSVREEIERLKKKEDEIFGKIGDEQLGRHAKTVVRDKSGKRRNVEEEQRKEAEEAKKKSKRDEKYMQWGKGVAQVSQQQTNVEDAMHEMSKPLTRYKDDDDLDQLLKEKDRAGDPMANFIKKKTKKSKGNQPALPRYSGPQPPPTRFNIWPGYRWDGVDRSNGFEKKLFASKTNKKSMEEIAYKWSTEDM